MTASAFLLLRPACRASPGCFPPHAAPAGKTLEFAEEAPDFVVCAHEMDVERSRFDLKHQSQREAMTAFVHAMAERTHAEPAVFVRPAEGGAQAIEDGANFHALRLGQGAELREQLRIELKLQA